MMPTAYAHKESMSVADLVHMYHDTWLLTRVNVGKRHRRSGIGTMILCEVCKDADENGVTLVLEPVGSGDMLSSQLVVWYRKHGFETSQPGVMKRRPIAPCPVAAFDKNRIIVRANAEL